MVTGKIILATVAKEVLKYAFKKGIVSFFDDNEISKYEIELRNVISNTIEDYKRENEIQDEDGKYPFYKSEILLQHLLKYRLSEELDIGKVKSELEKNSYLIVPSESELRSFMEIFTMKVYNSEVLPELNIKENFDKEIFYISDQLKSVRSEIRMVISELDTKLDQDYKEQIEEIEKKIAIFKSKTALEDLTALESRALDRGITNKKFKSKIEYLKGKLKRDLRGDGKEISKHFIKAYKLDSDNLIMKELACLEYFNLNDRQKCIGLADEIIAEEDYNVAAWMAKVITSENILSYLKSVPDLVKENPIFNISIGSWLVNDQKVPTMNGLLGYGIELDLTIDRFSEFTCKNKESWFMQSVFLLNKLAEEQSTQYVSGDQESISTNGYFSRTYELHKKVFDNLKGTELFEYRSQERFYYHYLSYWKTKNSSFMDKAIEIYEELKVKSYSITLHLLQVLNHQENFDKALEVIRSFEEENKGNVADGIYLFKVVVNEHVNKEGDSRMLFREFVDSIEVINDTYTINIIQVFGLCLIKDQSYSENELLEEIEYIKKKDFVDKKYRELIDIILQCRFLASIDKEYFKNRLQTIKNSFNDSFFLIKLNLSEELYRLGCYDESLDYDGTYIDKTKLSPELKSYIFKLHHRLRNVRGNSRYSSKELLSLLEKWRKESKFPDLQLLFTEHDLYLKIIRRFWKFLRICIITTLKMN